MIDEFRIVVSPAEYPTLESILRHAYSLATKTESVVRFYVNREYYQMAPSGFYRKKDAYQRDWEYYAVLFRGSSVAYNRIDAILVKSAEGEFESCQ